MKNSEKMRRLLSLLSTQGNAATTFNIAAARVFFAICENEGQTQTELAMTLGMPVASVSRIVRSLAEAKPPKTGLGLLLIDESSSRAKKDDWRAKPVKVSAKGRTLLENIDLILDAPKE